MNYAGPRIKRVAYAVAVDRPGSTSSHQLPWSSRVFPARYSEPILPEFPQEAVEARVVKATVRVDFLVGTDGLVRDLRVAAEEDAPHAELFAENCETVLGRWRFSPAWRLPRRDEKTDEPVVVLESRAHLVFRFNLEVQQAGGPVQMSFGAD